MPQEILPFREEYLEVCIDDVERSVCADWKNKVAGRKSAEKHRLTYGRVLTMRRSIRTRWSKKATFPSYEERCKRVLVINGVEYTA